MDTLVSYPRRGEGGNPAFAGNCSPRLLEDLFRQYSPRLIADPMMGSGTSRDVALRIGTPGFFTDLGHGFDVLSDEFPTAGFDMCFLHPPYFNIVKYTGNVWPGHPHPADLSRIPNYSTFIDRLNEAMYRCYEVLRRGGILAVLVGDVRRRGRLYPIQRDMRWFGEPDAVIIKEQHNCRSSRKSYGNASFVAIVHETLVITRKPDAWILPLRVTELRDVDLRAYGAMNWQAIIYAALQELGGEGDLTDIYDVVSTTRRARQAEDAGRGWRPTIRRELQQRDAFQRVERGRWRLAD